MGFFNKYSIILCTSNSSMIQYTCLKFTNTYYLLLIIICSSKNPSTLSQYILSTNTIKQTDAPTTLLQYAVARTLHGIKHMKYYINATTANSKLVKDWKIESFRHSSCITIFREFLTTEILKQCNRIQIVSCTAVVKCWEV